MAILFVIAKSERVVRRFQFVVIIALGGVGINIKMLYKRME